MTGLVWGDEAGMPSWDLDPEGLPDDSVPSVPDNYAARAPGPKWWAGLERRSHRATPTGLGEE